MLLGLIKEVLIRLTFFKTRRYDVYGMEGDAAQNLVAFESQLTSRLVIFKLRSDHLSQL